MKKLFIIALFVLGICNASVFGMKHEIILTDIYSFSPLDDAKEVDLGRTPDPTRFHAFIDGNHLFVSAHTDMPAYVEVINQETGEIVDEEFANHTTITIELAGSYLVQIYSGQTIMTGEFVVE